MPIRPKRAIFAVDPGGHTGVAWGIFDVSVGDVGAALGTRVHDGSTTFEGDERKQIMDLAALWAEFYRLCTTERGMSAQDVELVFEDFTLRPGSHGGGKDGTSPERITWGFEGFRMGAHYQWIKTHKKTPAWMPAIIWQTPGDSAAFGKPIGGKSQHKLKEWGVWIVGREHERSAWSHVALRIGKIQQAQRART